MGPDRRLSIRTLWYAQHNFSWLPHDHNILWCIKNYRYYTQWQDTFISGNHKNKVIAGRNLLDVAVSHLCKSDAFIIWKLYHLGRNLKGVNEFVGKSSDQVIKKELTAPLFYFSILVIT